MMCIPQWATVVAGWHLGVSTLQTHRNRALCFFAPLLFAFLDHFLLVFPLWRFPPFRKQGKVSLGKMIYLRRVRQSWQRKARRVFLLAARDLTGAWPTVSGTNDAPGVGSVGIASGLGRETLSDGSTAQPKKAQGWRERRGEGWDDDNDPPG